MLFHRNVCIAGSTSFVFTHAATATVKHPQDKTFHLFFSVYTVIDKGVYQIITCSVRFTDQPNAICPGERSVSAYFPGRLCFGFGTRFSELLFLYLLVSIGIIFHHERHTQTGNVETFISGLRC